MATDAAAGSRRQVTSDRYVDPDYRLTEVPAGARRGFVSLLVVLLRFTFLTPTMLAGTQIGVAFTLADFLWVILAGSVILGGYVAVFATIGARSGLTTVLLSRYTLGTGGAVYARSTIYTTLSPCPM